MGEEREGCGLTISPPMAATSARAAPSATPLPQRSPPSARAVVASGRVAPAFSCALRVGQ